ncbi:MAG TPA: hypothetical protein VMZ91_01305 [Candidatus Paceibacterota bacterium]|nr:hypothetical protein [Candidatus Paceibacterota bacterium]
MRKKEFKEVVKNKRNPLIIKDCAICGNVRCSPWGSDRGRKRFKCSKCGYKFIEGSSGDLKLRKAIKRVNEELIEANKVIKQMLKNAEIEIKPYKKEIKKLEKEKDCLMNKISRLEKENKRLKLKLNIVKE